MESQDKGSISLTPFSILRAAIKEVPPVKYALGVAGVSATVAIILGLLKDPKIAVWGTLIIIGLMFILLLFSYAVQDLPGKKWMVALIAWAVTIIFIVALGSIFTGFTFGYPQRFASYFGNQGQPKLDTHITVQPSPPQLTITPTLAPQSPSPSIKPLQTPSTPNRSSVQKSSNEVINKPEVIIEDKPNTTILQSKAEVLNIKVFDFKNFGVRATEKHIGERFAGRILQVILIKKSLFHNQFEVKQLRYVDPRRLGSFSVSQTRGLGDTSPSQKYYPGLLVSGFIEDLGTEGFTAFVRVNKLTSNGLNISTPIHNITYSFMDDGMQMDAIAQSIGNEIIKFVTEFLK